MNAFQQNLKSKGLAKKIIALVTAGTFAVGAGCFAMNFPESIASAAANGYHHNRDFDQNQDYRGHRGQFDPDQEAQYISECFGVSKADLLKYNKDGWRFNDLHRASFIAYAAQKPLGDVLKAKTTTNAWRDVSESFGITREKSNVAMDEIYSARMAKQLKLNTDTIKNLLRQGYHPGDISMAAALSKKTDKTIDTVLSMKKINNNWFDVANALGLSQDEFQQCRADARSGFGHGAQGGGHWNSQNKTQTHKYQK